MRGAISISWLSSVRSTTGSPDLDFLLARAAGHGLRISDLIEDAEWLTPWAAQLRYDEAAAPLDRSAAIEAATSAVRWARSLFGE